MDSKYKANNVGIRYFLFILLVIGGIWVRSSYSKFSSGNFPQIIASVLEKFASKNPYPWYKNFLETVAIPNSAVFGMLVLWGELFTAVTVLLGGVYLLRNKPSRVVIAFIICGLIIGALLNGVFWLAAGWTSPSTDSLNLLMLAIEILMIFYFSRLYKAQR